MEEYEIADQWKAYILNLLFAKRPRPQDISMEQVAEATGLCPEVEPDAFFDDVMDWLIAEDVVRLRANQAIDGQVFDAVLTSMGLAVMMKEDAGLGGAIGGALSKAAKALPSEAAKQAVKLTWPAILTAIVALRVG